MTALSPRPRPPRSPGPGSPGAQPPTRQSRYLNSGAIIPVYGFFIIFQFYKKMIIRK